VPASDVQRLVHSVTASGEGAILAQPLADTLKRADGRARVVATVDRSDLWRALTPQMFRVDELRAALADALASGNEITDEASAMELAGHPVHLVEGSSSNIKVTYPGDLPLAAFWLARQQVAA
jgi:2-C-methyl-D-erythritol 4-phosphate cytidylyltransferase